MVKRNAGTSTKKKASGYEVEKRQDGYYYLTAVPPSSSSSRTKSSTIHPGDRILEINGVKYTDFKTAEKANALFDMMVLDIIPGDDDDDDTDE
jgi:C-terminal processing protease CtpA/Prc